MRESWQLHNAAVRVQLLCDLIESSSSTSSMPSFPRSQMNHLDAGSHGSTARAAATSYYDPDSASPTDFGPDSRASSPMTDSPPPHHDSPPEYSVLDTQRANFGPIKPISPRWGYYRDDMDLLPRNRRGGYGVYRSYGAISQLPVDRDLMTFDLLAGVMPSDPCCPDLTSECVDILADATSDSASDIGSDVEMPTIDACSTHTDTITATPTDLIADAICNGSKDPVINTKDSLTNTKDFITNTKDSDKDVHTLENNISLIQLAGGDTVAAAELDAKSAGRPSRTCRHDSQSWSDSLLEDDDVDDDEDGRGVDKDQTTANNNNNGDRVLVNEIGTARDDIYEIDDGHNESSCDGEVKVLPSKNPDQCYLDPYAPYDPLVLAGYDPSLPLPEGWVRYDDYQHGVYFFHSKSGTLQRQFPININDVKVSTSPISSHNIGENLTDSDVLTKLDNSSTYESLSSLCRPRTDSEVSSGRVHSSISSSDDMEEAPTLVPVRFSVHTMGYCQLSNSDLTSELSSRTVNRCIVELSGKEETKHLLRCHDNVADIPHERHWTQGRNLLMDLDDVNLTLVEPSGLKILHRQPIRTIRVWGAGRDNSRDFAFVAKDSNRVHWCYVFRCDVPAKRVATTLRDLCKRLMKDPPKREVNPVSTPTTPRPVHLPIKQVQTNDNESTATYESLLKNSTFPTPMEEPQKLIRCFYLGSTIVSEPTGIEISNNAMCKIFAEVPQMKWTLVNVCVAPSTITIETVHESKESKVVIAECRVRFLSFLGIAQHNQKLCSFTMHTAQNKFEAHVFHCEPTASDLCKTIEAACKLRYQKCLDSNRDDMHSEVYSPTTTTRQPSMQRSLSSTLKTGVNSMLNGIKKIM